MTPVNTHKPEFPGKLYGLPTIIYSLTLLLGSLSMVFSEAPVFAGITVFILGAVIFTQARRIVPVLGILTPALFLIATTGNLTVPSIYIGFIYSFGVSAYLMIGKGSFRAITQEDHLEEGKTTHSSILAWRNPWIEGPGGAVGSHRVRHD